MDLLGLYFWYLWDPCALWEGFWLFRSLALLVSGIEGSLVLWVSVVKGLWNWMVSQCCWSLVLLVSRGVLVLLVSGPVWYLASKVTKTITFDVSGLNWYWSIGLSVSVCNVCCVLAVIYSRSANKHLVVYAPCGIFILVYNTHFWPW